MMPGPVDRNLIGSGVLAAGNASVFVLAVAVDHMLELIALIAAGTAVIAMITVKADKLPFSVLHTTMHILHAAEHAGAAVVVTVIGIAIQYVLFVPGIAALCALHQMAPIVHHALNHNAVLRMLLMTIHIGHGTAAMQAGLVLAYVTTADNMPPSGVIAADRTFYGAAILIDPGVVEIMLMVFEAPAAIIAREHAAVFGVHFVHIFRVSNAVDRIRIICKRLPAAGAALCSDAIQIIAVVIVELESDELLAAGCTHAPAGDFVVLYAIPLNVIDPAFNIHGVANFLATPSADVMVITSAHMEFTFPICQRNPCDAQKQTDQRHCQ